ncbi:hypothetical protein ACH5RR_001639 [Cinchona calisaya]|uniref:Uncharacterized protein n=1 Tax=Cinchona calisaya TaxID=153742 RepID=A0ABD3B4M1_9GENT
MEKSLEEKFQESNEASPLINNYVTPNEGINMQERRLDSDDTPSAVIKQHLGEINRKEVERTEGRNVDRNKAIGELGSERNFGISATKNVTCVSVDN